jgi:hypothetical protein
LGGGVFVDEESFFGGDVEGIGDFLEEGFFGVGEVSVAMGELDKVRIEEVAL